MTQPPTAPTPQTAAVKATARRNEGVPSPVARAKRMAAVSVMSSTTTPATVPREDRLGINAVESASWIMVCVAAAIG